MSKPLDYGRHELTIEGKKYVVYISKYNNQNWLIVHSRELNERIVEEKLLDNPTLDKITYYIKQHEKTIPAFK